MTFVAFRVGDKWSYPIRESGLQTLLKPGQRRLSANLVAYVSKPTRQEIIRLAKRPIRLGILSAPPLTWLALDASGVTLDSPYAAGTHGKEHASKILESASHAYRWLPASRSPLAIITVDTTNRRIKALRTGSLSREWWCALADALARSPTELSARDLDAAIERDYAIFPNAASIFASCGVKETLQPI